MPSPYFNGSTRPPGPPHDLIFGLTRPGGPPHDLVFGIDHTETCPPDWVFLPGGAVDANFAHCVDVPGGDWVSMLGGDVDVNFTCCDGPPPEVTIGPFEVVHGETLESSLSRNVLFDLSFYTGEVNTAVLETFPVVLMSANAYEGATKAIDNLRTDMRITVDFVEGATLNNFVLTTFPAVDLDIVRPYEGQTLNADLLKFTYVSHLHHEGAYSAVELEIDPYEGLVPEAFEGATLDVVLQYVPGFIPRAYTGETLTVGNLSTDYYLSANAVTGEAMTVIFTDNPPWNPSINFGTGETLTSGFSVGAFGVGTTLAYGGEVLSATLQDAPAPLFTFNVYTGENGALAMSFAPNLGIINAYTGETLTPETLEFDELWKFYEGARAEATISTTDTMRPAGYEGATMSVDVSVGKSESIGNLRFYEGASGVSVVAGLQAVYMSVTFADSYMFQAGMPYLGSYFDLDVSCCTDHFPGQQISHDIELNHSPFPDETYDGDKVDIDIDLSTNVRFQFNFFGGETAQTVDTIPYILGANMADGAGMHLELESVLNFRLCPGNFIPDGDNVYVELDFTDNDTCESNYIYAGETMALTYLEANQNFQTGSYEGSDAIATLTVPIDAFALRMYAGETLILPVELGGASYEGASMRFSFYEPPIIAAHGEHAQIDLVIKYDVRFLEVGCLENEYIYQDENGDPIPEMFNPVPVELDPYQHDILAICE